MLLTVILFFSLLVWRSLKKPIKLKVGKEQLLEERGRGSTSSSKRGRKSDISSIHNMFMNKDDDDDDDDIPTRLKRIQPRVYFSLAFLQKRKGEKICLAFTLLINTCEPMCCLQNLLVSQTRWPMHLTCALNFCNHFRFVPTKPYGFDSYWSCTRHQSDYLIKSARFDDPRWYVPWVCNSNQSDFSDSQTSET